MSTQDSIPICLTLFGSPAIHLGPVALRHRLAPALLVSESFFIYHKIYHIFFACLVVSLCCKYFIEFPTHPAQAASPRTCPGALLTCRSDAFAEKGFNRGQQKRQPNGYQRTGPGPAAKRKSDLGKASRSPFVLLFLMPPWSYATKAAFLCPFVETKATKRAKPRA